MAPKRSMARDLHLMKSEAVFDLLPVKGDHGNGTLHLRKRRHVDDLAGKQQPVEAVKICNRRYQRSRGTHPGHVKDAVVARWVDHTEPRLIHLRVRSIDKRSGR